MPHQEHHFVHRAAWLRAAVLGANDGIISTASLLIGVAAADSGREAILLAGTAGLIAGAISMAAGEYVSVHSQKDLEEADLEREKQAIEEDPEHEREELAQIYAERGVAPATAEKVAAQLMAQDALDAHARDELGIVDERSPRPIRAALASAAAFSVGAAIPLGTAWGVPRHALAATIAGVSLVALGGLGALGAQAGGAPIARATVRVTVWGAIAMVVTHFAGRLFGTVV